MCVLLYASKRQYRIRPGPPQPWPLPSVSTGHAWAPLARQFRWAVCNPVADLRHIYSVPPERLRERQESRSLECHPPLRRLSGATARRNVDCPGAFREALPAALAPTAFPRPFRSRTHTSLRIWAFSGTPTTKPGTLQQASPRLPIFRLQRKVRNSGERNWQPPAHPNVFRD